MRYSVSMSGTQKKLNKHRGNTERLDKWIHPKCSFQIVLFIKSRHFPPRHWTMLNSWHNLCQCVGDVFFSQWVRKVPVCTVLPLVRLWVYPFGHKRSLSLTFWKEVDLAPAQVRILASRRRAWPRDGCGSPAHFCWGGVKNMVSQSLWQQSENTEQRNSGIVLFFFYFTPFFLSSPLVILTGVRDR